MKALVFGEVLWDIYENEKHFGGAPMNFSAHFKKCGGEAWILTSVGDDELGKEAVCEAEKLDINTEYISVVKHETGKCLVTLDENRIPSYDLLKDVAYDYIKMPYFPHNFFDVLYFGTLALRSENNLNVLKKIIKESTFKDIFVDINIRKPYSSGDVVEFVCENASIIKISEEELPDAATGGLSIKESVQLLSNKFQNLRMIIITRGDKGAFVYECRSETYYECEAQKVRVVSTVGAGDSFSAAFLAKYMKTGDIYKALEFATKVSGYVVSCMEAIPDYKFEIC